MFCNLSCKSAFKPHFLTGCAKSTCGSHSPKGCPLGCKGIVGDSQGIQCQLQPQGWEATQMAVGQHSSESNSLHMKLQQSWIWEEPRNLSQKIVHMDSVQNDAGHLGTFWPSLILSSQLRLLLNVEIFYTHNLSVYVLAGALVAQTVRRARRSMTVALLCSL